MNYPKATIDRVSIERNTYASGYYLEAVVDRADKMTQDLEAGKRKKESYCVMCYVPYGAGRVGGAACTSRECGLCDTIIHSGNTNIDMLCQPCAVENRLCRHCGADVDLRNRRKKRKYETKKE